MIMPRPLGELIVVLALSAGAMPAHAQVNVSALLSMVGRNSDARVQSNWTNARLTPFDAFYARVFLDAKASDRLAGFIQFYSHDYDGATLVGAYVRYDHTPNTHLEAGLIPLPVGLWGQRTYADKNPLVSVPAIYQYKTSVDAYAMQETAEDILANRGRGEYTPMLYDFCWNTGIHGYASQGDFDFGLAATNGSLGTPRRNIIYNRPNFAAHINWLPSTYLTIGAWGSAGPFLSKGLATALPEGKSLEDYNQIIFGGLAHAAIGHLELFAEGMKSRFEHPYLGDLESTGGYADLKYSFATRWWAAGRVDAIDFSELETASANSEKWDYPLLRFEGGVGRRLSERALLKGVVQIVRYQDAPKDIDTEIYALQFTVEL